MRFVIVFPNRFLQIEVLITKSLRAHRERRKAWGFVRLALYVPNGEIELVKTIVKRISDPAVRTEWLSELRALTANETVTDLKV